jgi:hypothetical protein
MVDRGDANVELTTPCPLMSWICYSLERNVVIHVAATGTGGNGTALAAG